MSLMAPVFGYWVGLCRVLLEGSDIRLQGRGLVLAAVSACSRHLSVWTSPSLAACSKAATFGFKKFGALESCLAS